LKRKESVSLEKIKRQLDFSNRDFLGAISKRNSKSTNIIAEIKQRSPSNPKINPGFDIDEICKIYEKYASAISVVTDEKYFDGKMENLKIVRANTTLPILCKDFIIDEYQIYEARKYGADAMLLIVSELSLVLINKFIAIASSLQMDVLLEVKNLEEMKIALKSKAKIIGINNRNLTDFTIDFNKTSEILGQVDRKDKIIVSESGFKERKDLDEVKGIVDAVLIGTGLLGSGCIEDSFRKLI